MKIALFVSEIDQIGGAEIATRRLAEQLVQRGHQVIVLSTQSIGSWRKHRILYDYANDILTVKFPTWQRTALTYSRTLFLEAILTFPLLLRGVDILQLRGLTPVTVRLAQVAKQQGVKTLCVPMASGMYGDLARFQSSYACQLNCFHHINALTIPMLDEVLATDYPLKQTSIIPNGVDTQYFSSASEANQQPSVIYVGSFRPEKQIGRLLFAWQQVSQSCPTAQLTLVGGGRYRKAFQRQAAELGISPRFVAETDSAGVLSYLRQNNIFVMLGVSEGMSNALLEAMSVGLSPIVSDTPQNLAVITPEVNGLVYQSNSADDLAQQLVRLVNEPQLRQRLSIEAHRTIVRRFDLNRVTEQYVELYKRMIENIPQHM